MDNIAKLHDCYGCGVCAMACGKKIINLKLNQKGFYEPFIEDESKCVGCGLCLEVCSFFHRTKSVDNTIKKSYAGWSNDMLVHRKTSSGGVAFEIAKFLQEEDYLVCGVRYNPEKVRAEHFIASTQAELVQSSGSKYLQSYTLDAFSSIDKKKKYFVTGTPCQIDSFRRYIRKFHCEENFILLDFFCHGVPSMLMWYKYLEKVEKKTGKVIYASWRNKSCGWHDSWAMSIDGCDKGKAVDWHDSYNMLIRGKKSYYNSRLSQGDLFYKMFLRNTCLGKACYDSCKYKMAQSSADIRVGDLWGKAYKHDQQGVSGVLAFTNIGVQVLQKMKADEICTLIDEPEAVVMEGQMRSTAKRCLFWHSIQKDLLSGKSLDYINVRYLYMIQFFSLIKRAISKIKQML